MDLGRLGAGVDETEHYLAVVGRRGGKRGGEE
jgi:hypothetical protein